MAAFKWTQGLRNKNILLAAAFTRGLAGACGDFTRFLSHRGRKGAEHAEEEKRLPLRTAFRLTLPFR